MKTRDTMEEFDTFIKDSNVALVDFYAEWCGPCKTIAPMLESISGTMTEVSFAKVNIDSVPILAENYNIRSIPTMILFKSGGENSRIVGTSTSNHIREKLQELSK